jgi:hypothetical protein
MAFSARFNLRCIGAGVSVYCNGATVGLTRRKSWQIMG